MHYLMIVAICTVPGFRDFLLHGGDCPRERIEPFAHRVVDELDVFIMGLAAKDRAVLRDAGRRRRCRTATGLCR
jgi:hypothetical protein